MIVFARGSISEPEKLGPFVDEEMRVVQELKDAGVLKTLYRRAAGPGVLLILEGDSIDAVRSRCDTFPFVTEGLMTLERAGVRGSIAVVLALLAVVFLGTAGVDLASGHATGTTGTAIGILLLFAAVRAWFRYRAARRS